MEEDGEYDMGNFAYEIEQAQIETEKEEEDKNTPAWVYYMCFLVVGAIIGYYGGVYHYEQTITDYETPYKEQIAVISGLNTQLNTCENYRMREIILKETEINLTAMCWHDLDLCNYKSAKLMGFNLTKPDLVRELEKDKKDFAELSKRYHELEKKLGIDNE